MTSPLFTVQDRPARKTCAQPNGNTHSVVTFTIEPGLAVATLPTVEEAEDWYIAHAPVVEVGPSTADQWVWTADQIEAARTAMAIKKASNDIAMACRRGRGNVALMSPTRAELLIQNAFEADKQYINVLSEPEIVGRWTKVGATPEGQQVFTNQDFPDSDILIAFSMPKDGPICLLHEEQYHVFGELTPLDKPTQLLRFL